MSPPTHSDVFPSARDPEVFERLREPSVAAALWRHELADELMTWLVQRGRTPSILPAFSGPWPIARLGSSPDLELFGPLVARIFASVSLGLLGPRLEPVQLERAAPRPPLSPLHVVPSRVRAEQLARELGLMARWLTRVSVSSSERLKISMGPIRCETALESHLVSAGDGAGLVAHWHGESLEVVVSHDGPDLRVTLEPGDVLMSFGSVQAVPDSKTRFLCVMTHPLVPLSLRDFMGGRNGR